MLRLVPAILMLWIAPVLMAQNVGKVDDWRWVQAGNDIVSWNNNGDQNGTAPVPTLEAKWTDVRGVEHKVETPIASSTASGRKRAIALHLDLVEEMQRRFPPRPPE